MQQTILVKPDVKGFYESRTGSIQYVISDPIERRSAIIDPSLWRTRLRCRSQPPIALEIIGPMPGTVISRSQC
jgi:hypothetical protein